MKLKSKIIITSLVILVNILIGIGGWFFYAGIYTSEKSKVSEYLDFSLETSKHHLTDWLEKLNYEISTISENRNDELMSGYLKNLTITDQFDAWFKTTKTKLSADSISLTNTINELLTTGEIKDSSKFNYLVNNGYEISDPHLLNRKLLLDIKIIVTTSQSKKETKGLLFARIDLGKKLLEIQDEKHEGYKSEKAFFLLSGNRDVIFSCDLTAGKEILLDPADRKSVDEKRKLVPLYTTEGIYEAVGNDNNEILVCVKKTNRENWYLFSSINTSEISAKAINMFYKIVPLLLLIDLILVGGLFLIIDLKKQYLSAKRKRETANRNETNDTNKANFNNTSKEKELDLDAEGIGEEMNDGFAENVEIKLSKIHSPGNDKKGINMGTNSFHLKPKNQILLKLDRIKKLGYIPKIIFEVNLLIKKEPDNAAKLASLISKDLALTSKMISIANSPLYGLQRKVTSIEYAIILLGMKEVSRLVTAISLSDAVRFPSSNKLKYLDYWKHSMVVGNSSRDIALKLGFTDLASDAFLAGIFHDLGIPVLAKYFTVEYDRVINKIKDGKNCLDAEMEIFGLTHQEVGAYAAHRWELPEVIVNTIEYHHNPVGSENNKTLAGLVNIADWMTCGNNQVYSFWDTGISLENSVDDLLGFKSIEDRDKFIEDYHPVLQEAFRWVKL